MAAIVHRESLVMPIVHNRGPDTTTHEHAERKAHRIEKMDTILNCMPQVSSTMSGYAKQHLQSKHK